jgi:hypothetical protein
MNCNSLFETGHMLLTCTGYSLSLQPLADTRPLLLLPLSLLLLLLAPSGYSLNALVDFPADDPIEVIKHLIIGSEGTLGFVSQVRHAAARLAQLAALTAAAQLGSC